MSTLSQLRSRFSDTWENLAAGWNQLRRRAAHALTRFKPVKKTGHDNVETAEEQDMLRASRWGLLAADIWVGDKEVVVNLEVPGMDKNDFDIAVQDGHLVVRGTKYICRKQDYGHYHSMECAYGEFERAIALPVEVDEQQASATYRHGVLQIRLPKHRRSLSRRIPVDVEEK